MGEVIMGEEGTPIFMSNNNSKEKNINNFGDEELVDVSDSDFEALIDEPETDEEQAVDIASSLGFSDDSVKIYLQQKIHTHYHLQILLSENYNYI